MWQERVRGTWRQVKVNKVMMEIEGARGGEDIVEGMKRGVPWGGYRWVECEVMAKGCERIDMVMDKDIPDVMIRDLIDTVCGYCTVGRFEGSGQLGGS